MAKKRYKTLSKGSDPLTVIIGTEPDFSGISADDPELEWKITNSLNWYRNTPAKMYSSFIKEYMKSSFEKSEIARAIKGPKKAYEYFIAAAYGRISSRGVTLPKNIQAKLDESIQFLLSKNAPKQTEEAPKVSVQDYIRKKSDRLIGDLEEHIDDLIDALRDGEKFDFDLVEWFKKNEIKSTNAVHISNYFQPRFDEIQLALEGKDKDLKEAYGFFSKPNLRKYAKFYEELINLSKEQASVAKTTRKPRKKKEKTPAQLVAKLPYLKEHPELKLKSINPEEIVGCDRLVVYNTKTGVVCIYNSSELSSGLSVKGAAIVNYDIKQSSMKKVRDPKKSLPKFLGGLRAINNAYSEIKTKEKPVNGRMNANCIILQAITK